MVAQIMNEFQAAKSIEPGVHLPIKLCGVGTLSESVLQSLFRSSFFESIDENLKIALGKI